MIIWLASYPRSGNTFLRIVLNSVFGVKSYSIYDDRFDIGADKKTSEIVGHKFLPQDFDINNARSSRELYIIKTHGRPLNETDKVIYLIRDGRECTLSYLKYQQAFGSNVKDFLDVTYGDVHFDSWGEHVRNWKPKDRKNTLLIKFEELVDNPERFIDDISAFIDRKPKSCRIPTFKQLQDVNAKFFSSGKKNSWKDEISEDLHISFWLKNYYQMLDYGYVEDMPIAFKEGGHELFVQLSIENISFHKLLRKLSTDISKIAGVLESHNMELNKLTKRNKEMDVRLTDISKIADVIENYNMELNELTKQNKELDVKLEEVSAKWKSEAEKADVLYLKLQSAHKEVQQEKTLLKAKFEEVEYFKSKYREETDKVAALQLSKSFRLGRLITFPIRFAVRKNTRFNKPKKTINNLAVIPETPKQKFLKNPSDMSVVIAYAMECLNEGKRDRARSLLERVRRSGYKEREEAAVLLKKYYSSE